MIVVNFSHPLTNEHIKQIETLTNEKVERLLEVDCLVDTQQPLAPQVTALLDSCHLSPIEWQTLPILVNPPSLNFVAVAMLAELHGRCGYFPAHLRLRPVENSVPRRYEVAELLDLQGIRDVSRIERRGQ